MDHSPHALPGTAAGPPPTIDAAATAALASALHAHGITSTTDRAGHLVDANDRFCALMGTAREALLGTPLRQWMDPGPAGETADEAWSRVEVGAVWAGEMRMRTADNGRCWFSTLVIALPGADGAVSGHFAIHSDITEIKRTERALRESELRTRLLLQAADVGLWDWNLIDGTCYFSPEWKGQVGYEDHELPNTFETWHSLLHPQDRAATLDAVQAYREGRRPVYDVEFRMRHRDGSWRWIFARANFVRDHHGVPVRMLGSHTDITERKHASEALAASDARFKNVLEATEDGVWDLNLQTGAVYFSPQWERLLGYAPGEAPPRVSFFYSIVHPEDLALVERAMQDHLAGRTPIKQGEVRLRTRDGAYRWFLDRGKVVARDAAGVPLRMVGTITDIMPSKQVQAALRTSLVEKEALLKEVHHRVKNNLQVITSLLRLESMRRDNADTRAVLDDMQGRIRSMAMLHESLYRSGTFASVPLADYLGKLVAQAFRSQARSGDAVRLALDLQPVRVGMDQATPCGLLVNELVSNGLKHAFPNGRGGTIRVELHALEPPPRLRLRVSDDGVGLPEDFQRQRRSSLGLQLVEDLARQLGGTLVVGPGATFTVEFAADDPSAPSAGLGQNP